LRVHSSTAGRRERRGALRSAKNKNRAPAIKEYMPRAWPCLTTHILYLARNHPLASPLLSTGRCRRVDAPTSVRKFRVAPHATCGPLGRLPARFSAGRSGCHSAFFLVHYGPDCYDRTPHRPLCSLLFRVFLAACCFSSRSGVWAGCYFRTSQASW
jgi:hypothetical protein